MTTPHDTSSASAEWYTPMPILDLARLACKLTDPMLRPGAARRLVPPAMACPAAPRPRGRRVTGLGAGVTVGIGGGVLKGGYIFGPKEQTTGAAHDAGQRLINGGEFLGFNQAAHRHGATAQFARDLLNSHEGTPFWIGILCIHYFIIAQFWPVGSIALGVITEYNKIS